MPGKKLIEAKTFLSYEKIFGEKLPLRTLKRDLRQIKFPEVIVILAKINVLMALTQIDPEGFPLHDVNNFLINNFISPEVRRHPRAIQAQQEGDPFFVRHPLLALLRLCAVECPENAPQVPDGQTPGGYLLGRCCLAIPDHLLSKAAERGMSEGTRDKRRRHFGMHTGPTFEFNSPPDLRYAMARWDTMLTDLLGSQAYKDKLGDFDLAGKFFEINGIRLELYRDLIFTTLAHYYALKFENVSEQDFLLFHRSNYMGQTRLDQSDFDRFLGLCAIKLEDLSLEIRKFKEAHPAILPSLDFAVLRQRPILELGNKGLLCLDPFFMIDKLGYGLHHTIRDTLPSYKERGLVSKAYGILFELYVDSIMRQIYPRGEEFFISFPYFGKTTKGSNEAFDGILVCRGGHLIVFEYKGGFLAGDPKYSGKIRAFVNDLDKKFGTAEAEHSAGVSQMVRKIERLFHRDRNVRDLIPELQKCNIQVTKITPVLIVQEPYLRWDFNWLLNQKFKRLLRKSKVSKAYEVNALQVIDVESLEKMRPNLIAEDFRLEQCLNVRALDDPTMISIFFRFIQTYFASYGQREDPEIEKRFQIIKRRNLTTLFGRDDETGAEAAPG